MANTVQPYQIEAIGETSSNVDGDDSPRRYGDPVAEPGELLTLPEPQAAKKALDLYKSQNPVMERLEAQWEANAYRRAGYSDVRVIQSPDDSRWIARLPLDSRGNARSPDYIRHMNKAAGLCRKLTGQITADPPAPDAVPADGEDQDEDATEFANRALIDMDETMGEVAGLTEAIDKSHNCASVFRRYYFCEQGGPRMPIEVDAGFDPATGEEAQHVDEAAFRMVQPPMPEPVLGGDPAEMLGMPPMEPEQQPWPQFKKRMVAEDGSLTDEKKSAATRAAGEIRAENLTGNNVRLIPHACTSIEDAYGVQIALYVPWGKLKQEFPQLAQMNEEDRNKILSYRPKEFQGAVAVGQRKRHEEQAKSDDIDSRPCLTLTTYYTGKRSLDYPMGLYMVQAGDSVVLHRSTLSYTDEDGVEQPMHLPLSQVRLFTEAREHPYGVGLMEIVGPGGELRAAMLGAFLEALDRVSSAKTFVDAMSDLQPEELYDRSKRYVITKFGAGMPTTEQVQGVPQEAQYILESLTGEMNDASGLQETGQGLENNSVTSGVQAMAVVSQVQAALSPQARAVTNAYLRGCRIRLELVKAHYTVPRLIKWSTEDGRYKQKSWTRSDMGSTSDVRLKAGTMTMLRPAQKAMLSQQYLQLGILPPEEFRDATEHSLGGTLALQSDPYRLRIRRQISDWKDGPPEGWAPPQPPPPVMQMAPDAMGSMVPMQVPQPPPPDPLLMQMWEPVPSDMLPHVAQVRMDAIGRLMQSEAYLKKPKEWRAAVDMEFAKMQEAAAPPMPTMPGQPQGAEPQQPPAPGNQSPAPTQVHQQAQQSAFQMLSGAPA